MTRAGDARRTMTKVLYIEHDDDNLYMLKMRALSGLAISRLSRLRTARRAASLAATLPFNLERDLTLVAAVNKGARPDVILTDLEMPVVDRWEPVRTLKNDPQTCDILIIGSLESEREQAVATACDEFDVKPIEFESPLAT